MNKNFLEFTHGALTNIKICILNKHQTISQLSNLHVSQMRGMSFQSRDQTNARQIDVHGIFFKKYATLLCLRRYIKEIFRRKLSKLSQKSSK